MPAAGSTIRTVPGGKGDPLGAGGTATGRSPPPPLGRPTRKPTRTTRTTPRTDSPTTHAVRRGGPGSAGRTGGASTVAVCWAAGASTATPGPAGVVTSDQPRPSHQRTVSGLP